MCIALLMGSDRDPSAYVDFGKKSRAQGEFLRAVPRVVADLHQRERELSILGMI